MSGYFAPGPVMQKQVQIDKVSPGKPHDGKVLAAIHAHLDDIPEYCAGTLAKLIREGYTGYIIRTSNDELCDEGTTAQNIKSSEAEHLKMAQALGVADVFNFYYRSHRMNEISTQEIRSRLVFLFRFLKADTVLTFNPWGNWEENPDHWVTGRAVEEACLVSGTGGDYPEHREAGLRPHSVKERYYFAARPGQPYNRIVDIGPTIQQKIVAIIECKSKGGGDSGSKLRAKLAKEGKRLPILGNDDQTADREYVRRFRLDRCKKLGEQYGLEYAEAFYYMDRRMPEEQLEIDDFIKRNSIPL